MVLKRTQKIPKIVTYMKISISRIVYDRCIMYIVYICFEQCLNGVLTVLNLLKRMVNEELL